MLSRFKEIWYGILFGLGVIFIDAVMHSRMLNRGVLDELAGTSGEALFYRILFLVFGVAAGWFMWRNNRREREFRALQDKFHRFRSQLSPLVTLTHSQLQVALTRPESSTFPRELTDILQAALEGLRKIRSAIESS